MERPLTRRGRRVVGGRGRRGAVLGALEVAAGLLDEDVVERGLHELERRDDEAGVVERADDRRDVARAAGQRDREVAALAGRAVVAEVRQDLAGALEVDGAVVRRRR